MGQRLQCQGRGVERAEAGLADQQYRRCQRAGEIGQGGAVVVIADQQPTRALHQDKPVAPGEVGYSPGDVGECHRRTPREPGRRGRRQRSRETGVLV